MLSELSYWPLDEGKQTVPIYPTGNMYPVGRLSGSRLLAQNLMSQSGSGRVIEAAVASAATEDIQEVVLRKLDDPTTVGAEEGVGSVTYSALVELCEAASQDTDHIDVHEKSSRTLGNKAICIVPVGERPCVAYVNIHRLVKWRS